MRHIIFFIATLYWPSFWASDSPKETAQALKDYDRSVHLLDDWMRDPYITLAPDGWYYLTARV